MRDLIIAEAREWIGTPFRHQAFLKGVGADCIGLIGGVALALGLSGAREWRDSPLMHNYGPQPDPAVLLASARALLDEIPKQEAIPGDILVFRLKHDPQHFGLISELDPVRIIHSLRSVGRVTENIIDERWWRLAVAAFRFRGID